MKMETNGLATQYVDPACTLSQLEMDAVGVLLEFTPSIQLQEYAALEWSGKRRRSHRLGNFDYKEGEEFRREFDSASGEGETFVPCKRALINTEREKFSKDLDARAKSPISPLPSLQAECRTFGLGAWAITNAPQKVHKVAVGEESMLCKPESPPPKVARIIKDVDNARCEGVVESNPSIKQTSKARMQAGAQVVSKPSAFVFEGERDTSRLLRPQAVQESGKPIIIRNQILCKQLLKLAMSLAWEIKSMRQKKSLLMEELQSLNYQNFHLKQQHSSTKAIQTTDASCSRVPSLPCLAGDQCNHVLQNHRVMQEGNKSAGDFTDSTSGNIKHNSNASIPFTPSSIALTSQNLTECTLKDPNCISRTSLPKDINIPQAQVEAIVDQDVVPTSGDAQVRSTSTTNTGFAHTMISQTGAHAALSFSNEHGFIDAYGTWVIAPESLENSVDGVHAQLTRTSCGVLTQTTIKHQCVDDVPAQRTAPHHYTNRCVDGVPAQMTASPQNLNRCVDGAPFHPKSPPQSLDRCVDGISVQRARFLQSLNHGVDNVSVQLPCPIQILNNGALAQLALPSGSYGGSPQAIILLYDRKIAFAEARRRRKKINGIKRQQLRASRPH